MAPVVAGAPEVGLGDADGLAPEDEPSLELSLFGSEEPVEVGDGDELGLTDGLGDGDGLALGEGLGDADGLGLGDGELLAAAAE